MNISRRQFFRISAYTSILAGFSGFHLTIGNELPSVTLIGDSIRIGYQNIVTRELTNKAQLWFPDENCLDTVNILRNAHSWFVKRKTTIFHINSGLHDLKTTYFGGTENVVPLDFYKINIERIIKLIFRFQPAAKIIWATTTPIIDEQANKAHQIDQDFSRHNEDVIQYNSAAREVCNRLGVGIDDLYDLIMKSGADRLFTEDGVHFSDLGYEYLGQQVAASIELLLKS